MYVVDLFSSITLSSVRLLPTAKGLTNQNNENEPFLTVSQSIFISSSIFSIYRRFRQPALTTIDHR